MKVPFVRPYIGKPSSIIAGGRPYLKYESREDSIKDFIKYLDYVGFPEDVPSVDNYAWRLKFIHGYYGDTYSNYVKGLRFWMNKE